MSTAPASCERPLTLESVKKESRSAFAMLCRSTTLCLVITAVTRIILRRAGASWGLLRNSWDGKAGVRVVEEGRYT